MNSDKPDFKPIKLTTEEGTLSATPRTAEETEAINEFVRSMTSINSESKAAAEAGKAALPRLVKACYGHDNSQAVTIIRCLASIYNGSAARPVRLDDIRSLDWSLQKDLAAVIIGIGKAGFPDSQIRHEFVALGGEKAADALHWYTDGSQHKAALTRLVTFIKEHKQSSTARALSAMLFSIVDGAPANLSRLNYEDDTHTEDFVLILDGLFGRDRGSLHIEDVQGALSAAGISAESAALTGR
jgi:hypothetical protein